MTDKTIFGDMSEEEIRAEAGMGAAKSVPFLHCATAYYKQP